MYTSYYSSMTPATALFLFVVLIASLAFAIAGRWKMFEKAGKPGWASVIPFYSDYVEYEIFWGNGWLFLIVAIATLTNLENASTLSAILVIIAFIVNIMHCRKTALAFNRGNAFTFGLVMFPVIFKCILGFGKDVYFGIPQDGYSWKQIRAKFGKAEEAGPMEYEEPEEDEPSMRYEEPKKQSKAEDVITPEVIDVEAEPHENNKAEETNSEELKEKQGE